MYHNSRMVKQATQELGKSQSNKTEKNDTERNKTDSIPSYLINQTDKDIQDGIYKLGIAFAGKDVAVKSARRVDEELL